MEKSHAWTEDPILDETGAVQLNIEVIRSEVDEYATRAYKMGKANKEVRGGASSYPQPTSTSRGLHALHLALCWHHCISCFACLVSWAVKLTRALFLTLQDQVVLRLKDCIDDFKQILPMVEELANPALKKRHWDEIFQLVEADIPLNDDGSGYAPFSVRMLLQYNVLDKIEQIQTISSYASKEYSLEKVMEKMNNDWQGVEFRCV